MASKIIHAAGGIVVRSGSRRRFAVVQRSKDGRWVLPRGKLKRNERPIAGARREAEEETGFRVRVHEFLGAITYRARGRSKIVQFWQMDAAARPTWEVTKDVVAIKWLSLAKAVRKLSYPLEKLFLGGVGHHGFMRRRRGLRLKGRARGAKAKPRRRSARKPRATKSK
jgi:8-oxo-dGTP diphosphatase